MAPNPVLPAGAPTLMHVGLLCPDLAASLAFYRDGLGFTRTYEWDEVTTTAGVATHRGRALYLELGGHTYLELFDGGELSGDGWAGARDRSPVHHIALLVPDVDAAYQKCISAGGHAFPVSSWDAEPTTVTLNGQPPMTVRIAFVESPSGEVIELYEQLDPVR